MSNQVRLRLLPSARCLFDEPIQVKVAGLKSKQVVTMRVRSTDEKGVVFSSSATYRADNSGEIDLSRDASLSGNYVGVEPMGLLWSMRADALHTRFQKTNSLNPHVVNFSVHEEEGGMLTEASNERFLMGDGVSRVPVKQGNIRGVLFTPPGEGPFPAVLDLGSFMSEKRASLLANKGFIVLALPVFPDNSKLKKIDLDDFEEAVQFLQNQSKVSSKGVGVISLSKAGDIALSLATFVPGVEAVVWINGCSANVALPLYYKNRQILSALKFDANKVISTGSGALFIKYAMHDPLKEENKGSLVPIERASGRFLFAASEDDSNWDSKAYMDEMVDRLKRHGKENFESVSYPGAGHCLEPPFGPYFPSSFHGLVPTSVLWGGEPRAHATAEVHLWRKIQDFFRTHLNCDKTQTKSKL
ncbi:acyl-coenzyme A thioesterase 5-like [Poeciliopsis prolifica]|uniref:acyl-coenzyme A thioesterase 5-like n=1 Tax=Poeciliopsis prolifica TaxID=188132 RepID=UPI002413F7A7|nr:acyl-coenzyme A thioesterase 5-like [Poeciliopsis prolifica]XP_054881269.1 acyl-coenzyme A thioesterase 5-like [Poeciliopsis prolifica]